MTISTANWKTYEFGDLVSNLTRATKEPLSEGYERYVGLEHIEPGNIFIKSWGNVAEGTTFTRIFKKGHVLFGKRRAYQKKAALAEFDGVCSGDILVFEANQENIMHELLPFIVQSDKLFDYAIKTSAGSLSPRTKFKDLAKLKFKLPTLPEQKKLSDLLWSIGNGIVCWNHVVNNLEILIQSMVRSDLKQHDDEKVKISSVLRKSSEYEVGKIPKSEYCARGKYPIVDQSKNDIAGYSDKEELVYLGDLPVLVFGDHTTEIKFVDYPFILGADGTKVMLPKSHIDPKYLYYVIRDFNLKPLGYRRHFSMLKNSIIKVPGLDVQKTFLAKINEVVVKKGPLLNQVYKLKNIQKQIINQIFR